MKKQQILVSSTTRLELSIYFSAKTSSIIYFPASTCKCKATRYFVEQRYFLYSTRACKLIHSRPTNYTYIYRGSQLFIHKSNDPLAPQLLAVADPILELTAKNKRLFVRSRRARYAPHFKGEEFSSALSWSARRRYNKRFKKVERSKSSQKWRMSASHSQAQVTST
jgi:hypothetical protein